MQNFVIVLFKNKKKKRIIKGYKRKDYALDKYKKLLGEQSILFEVMYENDKPCNYEISLIDTVSSYQDGLFKTDSYGRNNQVFLKNENYSILKIDDYKIEELIYDFNTSTKITLDEFITKYLSESDLKVLYILNNKLVLQNDLEFNIFILKNEFDSNRLLDILEVYYMSSGKNDCLFIRDQSSNHKKWLYNKLSELGFKKDMLYRKKTNFS
jgi:hypothetical protein